MRSTPPSLAWPDIAVRPRLPRQDVFFSHPDSGRSLGNPVLCSRTDRPLGPALPSSGPCRRASFASAARLTPTPGLWRKISSPHNGSSEWRFAMVHIAFCTQGAGKTTHARKLADDMNGTRFSIDD